MMREQYFKVIEDIVSEAGEIALNLIEDSQPAFKKDHSVITRADIVISQLVHKRLADLLKTPEHILIDEEDPAIARYFDQQLLNKTPYIWAVDPIDATRSYANRMPQFGISIGLIRDLKPWLGAVYFPLFKELFYCDGENSYFVQNAFMPDEIKIMIKPIDQQITGQSVLLCNDGFFRKFNWDYKDCHVMIQACAAVELCWPAIGRGCGAVFRSSLWDFAGSWPIIQSAGLALRSFESGQVLDRLELDFFTTEAATWKLREHHILSSERNYSLLKNKISKIQYATRHQS